MYIRSQIGDLMADPKLTWDATLNDIWAQRKNIIVSYDNIAVVHDFPEYLWNSVQQRWANAQTLNDLKRYLAPSGRDFVLYVVYNLILYKHFFFNILTCSL